jgi:hypothetical protein
MYAYCKLITGRKVIFVMLQNLVLLGSNYYYLIILFSLKTFYTKHNGPFEGQSCASASEQNPRKYVDKFAEINSGRRSHITS